MTQVKINLDGSDLQVAPETTILDAARTAGVYIPSLCAHPALAPASGAKGESFVFRGEERLESTDPEGTWDGCGICAVEIDGEIRRACATAAREGTVVRTDSDSVIAHRQERLFDVLKEHPHACLTCAQAEGCPRTQCSSNVPPDERCCELLGSCELEKVSHFVGVPRNLPRYRPRGLPTLTGEPLFDINTELCIGCLRCVRACGQLRGVGALSFVLADGKPLVGTTVGPTRIESHCRFCGACIQVCPTGALLDRDKNLVPCRQACPVGIDIPRLLRHIAAGDVKLAEAVIRERVPLAFAVSYACFHPCEEVCRRGEVNEPISVCRLKRFAVDQASNGSNSAPDRPAASGKKVAIVGSGPAGLTAAYYLARKGHRVRIHEALSEPGGMLRVGIPEYRFPRSLLARDIEVVRSAGVEIRCNFPIDAAGLEKLAAAYDAVFIASGAHESKSLELGGSGAEGVYQAIDFLRQRALGELPGDYFAEQEVVVVGGGNVAVDAARAACRLGSRELTLVSLEAEADLPAWDWELQEAREEGIHFLDSWGPKEIEEVEGCVAGITLRRCTQVYDDMGNFSPRYDDGETLELAADAIILAIGQEPSSAAFAACGNTSQGTIQIDEETLETRLPRVFAGGDVATGPRSLVEAIAMGRRAAGQIDKSLGGDGEIEERPVAEEAASQHLGKVENFAGFPRRQPAMADPTDRASSFCALEEVFTPTTAREEAARCLGCDLRLMIPAVTLPPRPDSLLEFSNTSIEGAPAAEGVYQLYDEEKKVIAIKGVMNMREELLEALEENNRARFFSCEEDPMYTKRESELIQQYLQEHGEWPGGGDDELDDLF